MSVFHYNSYILLFEVHSASVNIGVKCDIRIYFKINLLFKEGYNYGFKNETKACYGFSKRRN